MAEEEREAVWDGGMNGRAEEGKGIVEKGVVGWMSVHVCACVVCDRKGGGERDGTKKRGLSGGYPAHRCWCPLVCALLFFLLYFVLRSSQSI